jgi:hypothetical protein
MLRVSLKFPSFQNRLSKVQFDDNIVKFILSVISAFCKYFCIALVAKAKAFLDVKTMSGNFLNVSPTHENKCSTFFFSAETNKIVVVHMGGIVFRAQSAISETRLINKIRASSSSLAHFQTFLSHFPRVLDFELYKLPLQ